MVKRILFVEDEPDIQDPMSHALRSRGYSVDIAGTAAEAKGCLIAQTYDLVIVDWRLPDGDGRVIADWAAELGPKPSSSVATYLTCQAGGQKAMKRS